MRAQNLPNIHKYSYPRSLPEQRSLFTFGPPNILSNYPLPINNQRNYMQGPIINKSYLNKTKINNSNE